jgi:two-component system, chemotaxis family, CheB/CheR fusion protein
LIENKIIASLLIRTKHEFSYACGVKKLSKIKSAKPGSFPVVGIGASAGGLDAFKKLIKAIPPASGMAYVLVQHLDPSHESQLPELLQKVTTIPVLEITNRMKVKPDHIYVIPSNQMMTARNGMLQLTSRPSKAKKERHLPIDLFFTSLAEVHQNHAIGVVLSGSATDGTSGLKAIKHYGGVTFAQDEKSAAYPSMPASAVLAGVVDFILPPEKIPSKIISLIKKQSTVESQPSKVDEDFFDQVISLIRVRTGADFTYYKKSTVRRRILRRMEIMRRMQKNDYLKYLRENKEEQSILFQEILIPVTSFFRDQKSFDDLKKIVFPTMLKLVKKSEGDTTIRIWVAGCSTGEEAYSIAIALHEFLKGQTQPIQIFATDINEKAIAKARVGVYAAKAIELLDRDIVKRYFIKKDGSYQIVKAIRDVFVFAVHNFLKDPPFSKLNMVSCRNVFIYMEPNLQKKALTTFHYALQDKGILLLGKTETTSTVSDLFSVVSKAQGLFTRKDVPGKFNYATTKSLIRQTETHLLKPETPRTEYQKAADDFVLAKYSPVGVVVNELLEVVYFRGSTRNFLEQSSGKPTHQLFKIAKAGLVFELRNLLHKVKSTGKAVQKPGLSFKVNGIITTIKIEVVPLAHVAEVHYLILFHEQPALLKFKQTKPQRSVKDERDLQLERLGNELAQTHEDMRSITEEQEAANEELQSANEELLSSSEESQSLNEELETSKEELQSTNEELVVVNQELISLNEHVTEAKEYAEGIIATIREPLLVLNKELRVKTANQSYYMSFNTRASEVEGKLLYELDSNTWDVPELRCMLETVLPQKSVIQDFEIESMARGQKRFLLLNARALTRSNNAEKLILLAFKDVTEEKHHQLQVNELLNRFQNLVAQAPVSICIIKRENYRIELANEAYLNLIQKNKDFIGSSLFETMPELLLQGFKEVLDTVLDLGTPYIANELEVPFMKQGVMHTGFYSFSYQPLRTQTGFIEGVIAVGYEVTEQVLGRRLNHSTQQAREKELEEKVSQRTAELKEANRLLQQENNDKAQRATELSIANELLAFENAEKQKRGLELVAANQELESFTYIASHDLQEPLRKIQTFSKRIMEKEVVNLSESGKDYFTRLERAAHRMQVLIEDLLLYSSTNSKTYQFEEIDLTKLAEEALLDFIDQIEEKKVGIDLQPLAKVRVVPFQFRQLFHNLIGNALKFQSLLRPLKIQIKAEQKDNQAYYLDNPELLTHSLNAQGYLHLIVADNGIGFEEKFNSQIFQMFQRLHGRDAYSGTGIGLSIVRKIIDNHRGIITARGELDTGAIFDIYIPHESS